MKEKEIVSTADVEWDSTFFGGNYSRIDSSTTQVPIALIEGFGNEEDALQLAVSENLETYQGLQPEMTITRLDEEEGEKKPEQELVYRYQVKVSTHQMLHQTLEIVSEAPLSDEQITEQTIAEAQKGEWTRGAIDQSIDIDDVLAEF